MISDTEKLLLDIRAAKDLIFVHYPGDHEDRKILDLLERTVIELRNHQHRYRAPLSWASLSHDSELTQRTEPRQTR